jgi:hypothetical protein
MARPVMTGDQMSQHLEIGGLPLAIIVLEKMIANDQTSTSMRALSAYLVKQLKRLNDIDKATH